MPETPHPLRGYHPSKLPDSNCATLKCLSVNWDRATLSGLWFPIPRKRTSAPKPKEHLHDVDVHPRRRDVQRREAAHRQRVHVSSVLQQELRDLLVSFDRCEVQRRPAESVRRVDLSSVLEEQSHNFHLSTGRCSAQRGPMVLIQCVGAGFVLEQQSQRLDVLII